MNRSTANDGNMLLNEVPFAVGDRVISSSKYSDGKSGVVWKVTDKAVHVRFDDNFFQKFHLNSKHHLQTKLECLRHFI
jgi:hypothetical protein